MLAAAALLLLFSACAPMAAAEVPLALPTSTPEPSATPTIVWFPPTATPTPLPTRAVTPTALMNTGVGEVLYKDLLAENAAWETGKSELGTVAALENGLTLAVSAPAALLTSLRAAPVLENFYLEVTARPNLCRGEDTYGVLVRSDTRYNTYRFMVACNGMVRVERLKNGEVVILQNWTRSGQLPLGAPLSARLGVWACGKEMRFFVDNVYQFSVSDPVWSGGQVGLFARSSGATALSVSFTEMEVREIETQNESAPLAAPSDPFFGDEMDH